MVIACSDLLSEGFVIFATLPTQQAEVVFAQLARLQAVVLASKPLKPMSRYF